MADLIKDQVHRSNLIILVQFWFVCSFCFYLISFFVKYIPGDIYINTILISVADLASALYSGIMARRIGAKKTITISFCVTTIGAILLVASGSSEYLVMIFIMVTRFGINSCYTLCFIMSTEYFPAVVCSSVFGFCTTFSSFSTVLSPEIAELKAPVPMLIYISLCTCALVSSFQLSSPPQKAIGPSSKSVDDTFTTYHPTTFSEDSGRTASTDSESHYHLL